MILVTGGTGLVGSHLLLALVKNQEKVRAIHRKNSNLDAVKKVFEYYSDTLTAKSYFEKIEWMEASLADIPALTFAFKDVSRVYHCAALVSFDSAQASALRKTNIEGTANIVNLCIGMNVEKLLYVSSVATMDLEMGEKYITENFTWHPEKDHSDYAISKHGAEIEVWRGSQEGLPVVILNPGVILGPGFWNKGTGQIFRKIDKGLNYHFPKTTGFVGVEDVVKAAVLTMDGPIKNEQYILVAENLSFEKVLKMVAAHLQKPAPKKQLKPWMVIIGWIYQTAASAFGVKKIISKDDNRSLFEHTYYSSEKIRKYLNFSFTPVEEVIEKTSEKYNKDKAS